MKPLVFNYADYERLKAITDGIPLDRIKEICRAERGGYLFIGGIDLASGPEHENEKQHHCTRR
jgi:hypothetical protein